MKKILLALSLLATAFITQAAEFHLSSSDVAAKGTFTLQQVYSGFGCTGANISPALSWSGAPAGTQSYALTVYDPDAPTGSGWWHWVMINVPATAKGIDKGAGTAEGKSLPAGTQQIRTDFGTFGYGGPCPPAGDKPHRYIFTLHALKVSKLDVPADATAALAGFMINANTLAKATFTAYFGRKE